MLLLYSVSRMVVYNHYFESHESWLHDEAFSYLRDLASHKKIVGRIFQSVNLPSTPRIVFTVEPWIMSKIIVLTVASLLARLSSANEDVVRVATFNLSLNRFNQGDLQAELCAPGSTQASTNAESRTFCCSTSLTVTKMVWPWLVFKPTT